MLALAGAGLAFAVALLAWGRNFVRVLPFTVDDAFITYRYARNLALHGRPVFNLAGARAEGYTSPLWMLASAAAVRAGVDPARVSKLLAALATAATLAVIATWAFVAVDRARPGARLAQAALAVMAFAAFPATAIHAASGMETVPAALGFLLVAAAATSFLRSPGTARGRTLALACLVAGLLRPEANLFAGVALATTCALAKPPDRMPLVRDAALSYVLPGGFYFAARAFYYGKVFPLPFYVKVEGAGRLAGAADVLGFLSYLGWPLLVLAAVGLWASPRMLLPGAAGAVAHLTFFLFPAHIMGFEWRYPFTVLPILVLLAALTPSAPLPLRRPAARAAWVAVAVGAVAVTAGRAWSQAGTRIEPYLEYARNLERAHVRLGKALAACANCRGMVLAMGDAGATPYYSRLTTIDTFGLNDRHLADAHPYDVKYVLQQRPGLLVLISYDARSFRPRLAHEAQLYQEALDAGYRRWRTLEFAEDYHLWLMVPEDVAASDLPEL